MERKPSTQPDRETPKDSSFDDYQPVLSQQLQEVSHVPHVPSDTLPSALKALLNLTGATTTREIGLRGPVLAASATEHNQHIGEFGHYQEVYPRDAYVSAELLWPKYPELTKATILTCLPYIGTVDTLDDTSWRDEQEIGKLPHQIRDPDHPRSKRQFELRNRGYPYYGAIDTTQKNILAITRLCLDETQDNLSFLDEQFTTREGETATVAEGLQANVDWVLARLASNPEGIIESLHINPRHHANQSWADSPDSFHHADGSLARHYPDEKRGVASIEVNAETYDALLAAARLYEHVRDTTEDDQRGSELSATIEKMQTAAARLKQAIHAHFWVEDEQLHGGYFARGTDRDEDGHLHPLKIRSSDMGHLLKSEVLDDDDPKVISLIKNLFSDEMLAANGIRTLSSDSLRYHPSAYHNGSVWPWDTYTIARGLEKRGYTDLSEELERRILEFYQRTNTLAEYGSGDSEGSINLTQKVTVFDPSLHEEPIDQYSLYNVVQPPQEIQAWTVATILAIKSKKAHRTNR